MDEGVFKSGETDRQTDRRTDRDRQGRKTQRDRGVGETDRQTDGETETDRGGKHKETGEGRDRKRDRETLTLTD